MRITKRQLKRIIKEEKAKILNEATPADIGFAAARHEGSVDYGHIAQQVNRVAGQIEEIFMATEGALLAHDQASLSRDLEKLLDDAYGLAMSFNGLAE
jgi:hypothetical protein